MFTGIIETTGVVARMTEEGTNIHIEIASPLSGELRIDQSLAHDGICLTVVALGPGTHTVTAVQETLERTALRNWKPGALINLERAMILNSRLDGHIVQGHVDQTGHCLEVEDRDGSWFFTFSYQECLDHLLVDKGSICINGVSLTVIAPTRNQFSVAIIPYTYEHTNFSRIRPGDPVNLEFDIIGKYVRRITSYELGVTNPPTGGQGGNS